jgi:NAD(P)-dependent dehydrogenase (short-subunit alcohol dehydrogenase family)
MEGKRVVLVTGAGGRIGQAIVRAFLAEGDSVAAADLDEGALVEIYDEEISSGQALRLFRVDMSVSAQVKDLGQRTLDEYKRIDVLVNNAGINKTTPIEQISSEEWDYVMNVNLRGPFELCQCFLERFKEQRGGRIINISSSAAKVGGKIVGTHYTASKAGMLGLTIMLAKNLAEYAITANAICPGPIDTAFHAATSEAQKKIIAGNIPLGRFGRPEELAAAVVFLASEKASFITGEIMDVNGGLITD